MYISWMDLADARYWSKDLFRANPPVSVAQLAACLTGDQAVAGSTHAGLGNLATFFCAD